MHNFWSRLYSLLLEKTEYIYIPSVLILANMLYHISKSLLLCTPHISAALITRGEGEQKNVEPFPPPRINPPASPNDEDVHDPPSGPADTPTARSAASAAMATSVIADPTGREQRVPSSSSSPSSPPPLPPPLPPYPLLRKKVIYPTHTMNDPLR